MIIPDLYKKFLEDTGKLCVFHYTLNIYKSKSVTAIVIIEIIRFETSKKICISIVLSIFLLCLIAQVPNYVHGQEETGGIEISPREESQSNIVVNDPKLNVELVTNNLKFPTTMDFLGPNDILVLEKDNGTVMRVVNGTLLSEPLLDVKVATEGERGMLGIAVTKSQNNNNQNDTRYVFLYYTEAKIKDGGEPIGNRLYRYRASK